MLLVSAKEGKVLKQDLDLRSAISLIIEAGYQIDKEAFEFLKQSSQKEDLTSLIEDVLEYLGGLPKKPFCINRELLEKRVVKFNRIDRSEQSESRSPRVGGTTFRPYAKEIDADLKVLEDPSNKISTTGSIEDYIEYFRDRFRKLCRIMNNRMDVRDACTIADVSKASRNSKIKIICLITEKRESGRGVFLQVEDLESSATIFVPSKKNEVFRKAQRLTLDQIACICIAKGRSDLLIAEEIIFPDVPLRKPNKASIPVYAALLSDLHVGSKMFMEEAFRRFIRWLNGKVGDSRLRDIASHIKYVVIAGDVVDGVGVYPRQIDELEIKDIHGQYETAAKMIEGIPDYIKIIVIPGNHDATRRALPQPCLPKEFAQPLYESKEIYSLGNPSVVSIHGVKFLLLHGRSLDDVILTVPGMKFRAPDEAMKFLLKCRHVAPVYGLRTMISAEKSDHLVIQSLPDVFVAGHVHMMKHSNYRGILVVNSGAWQRQTEYQREMGHTPNPGIIPVADLQNLQILSVNFASNA